MRVKDVMRRDFDYVDSETPIVVAATKMRRGGFEALPVVSEGLVIGMLTDRDITVRGVAKGRDPRRTRARELMSNTVACCYEDQELPDAAGLMKEKGIRHLVVVDRGRKPVGTLSLRELAIATRNAFLAPVILSRESRR